MFNPRLPFQTLLAKESKRMFTIWIQTILTPVITTGLYLVIFGVSLGGQIRLAGTDVPYLAFIIPGLVMMGIVNNSAMNSWGSVFLGKVNGYLNDILMAPLSYLELSFGYILPGALRGLVIGGIIWLAALPFGGPFPSHPVYAFAIAVLSAVTFSSLGIIVAVWAKDFDQMGAFNTFILLPLVYLGGVFYSLRILPDVWQTVSRFNPIFYMVDGLRYGFFDHADTDPTGSLLFVLLLAAASVAVTVRIFRSGWRLKS